MVHRQVHEAVAEALQLVAVLVQLAGAAYALGEDDDRLFHLQHLGAVQGIADDPAQGVEVVAEPGHGGEEALDHGPRQARAGRVGGRGHPHQHPVHRQLAAVVADDQRAALRRDVLQAVHGDAEVFLVEQLAEAQGDLEAVLVIAPGVVAEAADGFGNAGHEMLDLWRHQTRQRLFLEVQLAKTEHCFTVPEWFPVLLSYRLYKLDELGGRWKALRQFIFWRVRQHLCATAHGNPPRTVSQVPSPSGRGVGVRARSFKRSAPIAECAPLRPPYATRPQAPLPPMSQSRAPAPADAPKALHKPHRVPAARRACRARRCARGPAPRFRRHR